jgi:hypothetical protein
LQGLSLFTNGTLHGNVNLYQGKAQDGETKGRNYVEFRKTRKVTKKQLFKKVNYDINVIRQLKPNQKKSFFRQYKNAETPEAQAAAIKISEEVAARNQQKMDHKDTTTKHYPAHTVSKATDQVQVAHEEIVELVTSDNPEAMEMEPPPEQQAQLNHRQVLDYLDGLPKDALEAYLSERLADKFVPKQQFEEVAKRLQEVDDGHISETED